MTFQLLGRRLDTKLAVPALTAWLERHWRFEEHGPDAHPFGIQVEDDAGIDEPARDRGWQPVEAMLPGGATLRGWRRGDEWRFVTAGTAVAAHIDGHGARIRVRTASGRLGGVVEEAAPVEVFTAIYLCITESLRASGLIPLHAAVVVRGEEAVALSAPSGTGKSTTLLRLLSRGWHPLAEDLAWLDPGTWRIYGWDRGVRLWPDGVARLPAVWREAAWRADVDGKRLLPWTEIRPARRPMARLRRIVRLERGGTGLATLEPLPAHEAVRMLWETMGVPLTDAARHRASTAVPELLRRVECARFRLEDANEDPCATLQDPAAGFDSGLA